LPSGYGFIPSNAASAASSSSTNKKNEPQKPGNLNVRLDTQGGVTYSPSDLTSHNVIKRMFIPYKLGDASAAESSAAREAGQEALQGAVLTANEEESSAYDFEHDLEKDLINPEISEARKYALSVDLNRLTGRPEGGLGWDQLGKNTEGVAKPSYAKTTSAQTSTSVRSTATTTTLATQRPDGSLPDWYMRPSAKKDVTSFTVPTSYTGRAVDQQRPWDAMRWTGHRRLERPSRREYERGIAAFEEINGPGRAPSLTSGEASSADSASGASTVGGVDGRQASLGVADLFVIDPRLSRPLRMVRRTDPRQVLLLCSGVYLQANEVATMRAAQAARDAGLSTKDVNTSKQAQDMLVQLAKTSEACGGIGVVYCPSDDPLGQDEAALQRLDPRFEVNTCKRLEGTPTTVRNSLRRAQLRAVLAALELANWEDEGFDKIVIGVEEPWIVRGITVDIWTWRKTGWTLAEHSSLGGPGESVPDRDMWELIDEAVRKYESIDCNVRFWHVARSNDMALTRKLAHQAALRAVQQRPALVRWRKKLAPTLVEQAERRKAAKPANHQELGLTVH
jgi:hypothetical protein